MIPPQKRGEPAPSNVLASREAERAVLGCCLAQPKEVLDDVCTALTESDFYHRDYQTVFKALRELHHGASIEIDVHTVHQKLEDMREAEHVKSPGILAEVMNGFSSHLVVGSYIQIVKDKALLRNLQTACYGVLRDIQENPEFPPDVMDRAEQKVFEVCNAGFGKVQHSFNAAECCDDFRRYLDEVNNGVSLGRVATGIKCIDFVNNGFPKPAMTVVAGPPGGGKSAFMGTLIENWCKAGHGVGVFSLDMTKRAVMQRRVGSLLGEDTRAFNEKLPAAARADIDNALAEMRQWNFRINDSPRLTSPDIGKQARKWRAEGIDRFIVDHFQRIASSGRYQNKLEEKEQAARDGACYSKELDASFVYLSQIKASSQEDGNAARTIHLAETKVLGEEARAVYFLKQVVTQGVKPNIRAVPFKITADKYSEGETHEGDAVFNMRSQIIR